MKARQINSEFYEIIEKGEIMYKKCDLEQVFDIMQGAFSKNEFRPYSEQENLLANNKYKIITNINVNGKISGFLSFWDLKGVRFIEHIAVKNDMRGMGIGSKLVNKYLFKNPGCTVLEVEVPDNEIKKRRIRFYERLGFHLNLYFYSQPSFIAGQPDIPMYIMSHPGKLNFKDFVHIRDKIYRNVYFISR